MLKPEAVLPKPSAAARQTLATVLTLSASDPGTARRMALPLLGQPALHAEALVLIIELSRRLGDGPTAAKYARRAANLAPKSGKARTVAAMALREAGCGEEALFHGLAAMDLTPNEPGTQIAVVLAALTVGRPLAGLNAAMSLIIGDSAAETLPLCTGLFDACCAGSPWGIAWTNSEGIAGCVRRLNPTSSEIMVRYNGIPLGRTTAETAYHNSAQVNAFCLALSPDLPAGSLVDVIYSDTGSSLFGSPVRLPEFDPRLATTCASVKTPNPPLPDSADMARLNGWLRETLLSPTAPPPFPEICLGLTINEVRRFIATRAADLETKGDLHG